jgi:surface antigen
MPQGVARSLYRVVAGKNSRDLWLSRSFSRWLRVICVMLMPLCGCVELAGPLLVPLKTRSDETDITGSLVGDRQAFSFDILEDADRPVALAALGQALDPMNEGQSTGWSSQTGQRRGSFAARGLAFVHDEQLCRDFVASVETRQSAKELARQQWSGTACRKDLGAWTVVERPRLSKN